ncbi:hypothetical protein [Halobacteriovorax sp. HLS]|uniref:hypothetical protein n=1 Tax=Halobacteriovorax sp. HLS TaxID=2234000 RepID=UPI000FDA322E|nr:hypothetical protein [Halobacteriovorax sp. HLS]
MNKFTIIILTLLNLLVTSCGALTGADTGANLLDDPINKIIGGLDAITTADGKFLLRGTSDNGGNSAHSFHLKFKLPEGRKLKFHFFSSRDLSGGADFEFSKNAGKVSLEISINGKSHLREISTLNNTEVIDIDIDIHNDHTDVHMLAWDHLGTHSDDEDCTFDGGCLYNTEDFAFDTWLGVGKAGGSFWGFSGDSELIILLEGPLGALSDA